jgi:hypothetical protein
MYVQDRRWCRDDWKRAGITENRDGGRGVTGVTGVTGHCKSATEHKGKDTPRRTARLQQAMWALDGFSSDVEDRLKHSEIGDDGLMKAQEWGCFSWWCGCFDKSVKFPGGTHGSGRLISGEFAEKRRKRRKRASVPA